MRKYKFKSKRVKKFDINPNQPDYYGIIRLNKSFFTLTGWLDLNSDISYVLQEVTEERLKVDKYLRSEFAKFLSGGT